MLTELLHMAAIAVVFRTAGRHQTLSPRQRRLGYGLAALLVVMGLLPGGLFMFTKWLGRMAMPPALVWLALMGIAVRLQIRGMKTPSRWVMAVCFVYWLASFASFSSLLMRVMERPFRDAPAVPEGGYEAVLVLGGGTMDRPDGTSQLSPGGDRVATVARMYHRGQAQRIVSTGSNVGFTSRERQLSLGAQTNEILVELGVPTTAVVQVPGPRNTKEEMEAMAGLVAERGWTKVAVVSSAYHLRRAMRHADRLGLSIAPRGADFKGRRPYPNALNFIPSSRALDDTRAVCWELLGALVGR